MDDCFTETRSGSEEGKAHILLYHSTLGSRITKKKKKRWTFELY